MGTYSNWRHFAFGFAFRWWFFITPFSWKKRKNQLIFECTYQMAFDGFFIKVAKNLQSQHASFTKIVGREKEGN